MHTISSSTALSRAENGVTAGSNGPLSFAQNWRKFVDILIAWQDRSRQRHALGQLDARLLRDIGIDRLAAAEEASKPFWRA